MERGVVLIPGAPLLGCHLPDWEGTRGEGREDGNQMEECGVHTWPGSSSAAGADVW